jgi:peptide/nickel transport system permease protein
VSTEPLNTAGDIPELLSVPSGADAGQARSPRFRRTVADLLRRQSFVIGALIVAFWVFMALFSQLIAPYGPYAVDPTHTFASPSSSHWVGTDELGRDVFSRVLAGARTVLTIAPAATLLALIVGTTIGLAAGFYRGVLDDVLMRTVDAFLALPSIVIGVVVLGLLGPSELNVILVIGFFFSPLIARTVRSAVLVQREREYVRAARMRGEHGRFIMYVELFPNVTGPIVVEGTIRFGYAVFTAATLSFLGVGVQPPSADWGLTVASERGNLQTAPWTVLGPAIALASLVVGVNLIADSVRRTLQD